MSQKSNVLKRGYVKELTKISVLGAVATVLMLLETPLWFAPEFYKIDLSEIAVLIGGFALGPVPAVMIELIKILLNLAINGTVTGGVGEAANFLIGCSLVLPASIIYARHKSLKSAIIGLLVGTLVMTTVGTYANYIVLLPVYAKVFGVPLQVFIDMGNAINKNIVDLTSFVLYAVAPFNLLKGIVVSAFTILIYKRISPILHR
jgi:riboflavin transporter